jgi:hypothetical protein
LARYLGHQLVRSNSQNDYWFTRACRVCTCTIGSYGVVDTRIWRMAQPKPAACPLICASTRESGHRPMWPILRDGHYKTHLCLFWRGHSRPPPLPGYFLPPQPTAAPASLRTACRCCARGRDGPYHLFTSLALAHAGRSSRGVRGEQTWRKSHRSTVVYWYKVIIHLMPCAEVEAQLAYGI